MKITDAIEEYLGAKQNAVTHDTYVWYCYHLDTFGKWCSTNNITELPQITPALVQKAVSTHPRTNSNTRHGYVQVVKGFLRWCSEDAELGIREKTVKRIELPKTTQPDVEMFSDAEIMRLFRACDALRHPHRNRAALHLLLDTGIRISEMVVDGSRKNEETGLLSERVVLGRGTESYITVMGKGRKARTIGIGNETRLAIQKYIHRERGHSDSPYLFLAQGDEAWSVRMVQQFLKKLGEVAKVEDVHAHRFRHTWAVNQLMNGTSDLVLMRLMGHTTLESTKIYSRAMSNLQARKAASSVVDQLKKRGGGR